MLLILHSNLICSHTLGGEALVARSQRVNSCCQTTILLSYIIVRVMCSQPYAYLVIHVKPFWVVVVLFRDTSDSRHKSKGFYKILKLKLCL